VAGIADPNFKARLLTLGVEANPFCQLIADEIAKWPKVINCQHQAGVIPANIP
jgi:hypothetical protein